MITAKFEKKSEFRNAFVPLLLVFVLGMAIVAATICYWQNYENNYHVEVENQLGSISELKVSGLLQYRKERLWDAESFFKNPAFSGLVRRFLDNPEDTQAQQQIQEWTAKFIGTGQYDLVRLIDTQGVTRLSVPAGGSVFSSDVTQTIPEVLRSGQVTFMDFYRNNDNRQIHLMMLVPILDGADNSRILGILAMRINPETYLYPFMKRWPIPSDTAETQLVRRDGNDALFLNNLRFQTNSALNLRLSLTNRDTVSVKAVLGQKGIVEGMDYRGVPVLADLEPIPDSPWILVTHMDSAEVYAPLHARLILLALIVILLLVALGSGGGAIWRQQRAQYYKAKYEAEANRARLSAIVESSNDAIISKDLNGIITSWNKGAEHIFGCSAGEMVGTSILRLIPRERVEEENHILEKIMRGERVEHFDTLRQTKDGRLVDVSVTASPIKDAAGKVIGVSKILRDITEHKRVEAKLHDSEKRYRGLFEHMVEGFALCRMIFENGEPRDWIYLSVNPMFEKLTGLKNVTGKRVSEIIPDIANSDPELFKIYGQVSLTGKTERFEMFVQGLQQWFLISVYSPEQELFVAVFDVITERKKVEATLRISEDRYRALFDRSRDCVYLYDFDGKFLDANQAALDLIGYQCEEFAKLNFASLLTEDQLPLAFQVIEEIKTTGQQKKPTVFRVRSKDGRQIDVETLSSLINQDGKPFAVLGIARDITERERAAEALRTSQQITEGIMNAIPVRVFWKDKNLIYLGCNKAFAHDAGFADPKDIIGKDDYQMVWRDQAELYRGDDRKVIETGCPKFLIEEPQTTPDGKIITLLTSKLPLRDSDGKISGVLGTYMDITGQKRMEKSHTLLSMAVDQAAETVMITDNYGTILYVNPAFEKVTGYTSAEVIGQNPRILNSGKQNAGFYRKMWEVLGCGEVWEGHFINRRKDGTFYEEEATISPMRNPEGVIVNYVAVKHDVTREVQLEAQLIQSQKMDAIGQLAAGVAHDFNNILAAILLQADVLKTGQNLSSEQMESAGDIAESAEKAANLTRQLLLFSRKQAMQQCDLDLNQSINEMTKMLRRILGENIKVMFKFAMQPLIIHADATMLDQVLMNLAVNARDAMPKGGQLVIETTSVKFDETVVVHSPQARPGSFVCLSVSDNGSGIPAENLPRIFEPFFTTKTVGKGTGMGLATVYGIVQQHKGWINVYSEVGHGTTFRIYIPQHDTKPGSEGGQHPLTAMRGGDETILIVEDERTLRSSIRGALTKLGYCVLESANAADALEIWKQHGSKIHLLLTDIIMPGGMTGKELAGRLTKENPKLKVIYMSGYIGEIAGADFEFKEGVNFLTKPFGKDKLAQIVRDNLDAISVP